MGFGSLWHWVIVLLVVLILFGRGRISEIMGDFGSGIKSFKHGMDDDAPADRAPQIGKREDGVSESETTRGHA